MKKKISTLLIYSIIILITINIFIKSKTLTPTIIISCNLFMKNIFPSLFPMFIISALLIELNIPKTLGKIFEKPFNLLFKSKKESAFIFFMSMLTGFPSSAKFIDDLINKKIINNKDANKILTFTFFSNPLFIINTIGINFFKNKSIGIIILISHILGNVFTGIIFRNYNKTQNITKKINTQEKTNINTKKIFEIIQKSITESLNILINIFGLITFILIIINTTFKNPTNITKIIPIGLIEMTTGLKYLSLIEINQKLKIALSTFFISFGGLSIHLQIMNILNKKKVKYIPFLISRIIHAIISTAIALILTQMDIRF